MLAVLGLLAAACSTDGSSADPGPPSASVVGRAIEPGDGNRPTDPDPDPDTDTEVVDGGSVAEPVEDPGRGSPSAGPEDRVVDAIDVDPAVWERCGDGFECATVTVPVDVDDPDGPSIDLALARLPAGGDPDELAGSIFVNPGGPGASGVGYVRSGARLDPDTMDRYHLVGFDPRGIGASAPLSCATAGDGPQPDLAPDDEAERAELDGRARELAQNCERAHGPLLRHLGTDAVVDDLELLRRAVGDERLHYVGFSYGTFLGLRYAERYPDRVGRMVLDGVVDPAVDLAGLLAQQADAFEGAFAAADAGCGPVFECPDGGLAATYDRIEDRLDGDGPVDGVGPTELAIATLISLYEQRAWPRLALALGDADRGDVAGVRALYDIYAGAVDTAAYHAVLCIDSPSPSGAESWDRLAERLADRSPRFGAVLANEVRACAHWPVRATEAPEPVSPDGLAPVLVLSTTGDPATPLANAVAVAGALDGAGLVTVDDASHIAYGRNGCVDRIVADYLASGRVPPTVHRC